MTALLQSRLAYKWQVMLAVTVGVFMTTIDSSIVNIALPGIGHDFGAQLTSVEWVSIAYVVSVTGFLPAMGRLSDMRGRKRMYVTGFAVFTVASGLCALSPTLGFLIGARALQALGGAMMYANSMAIIAEAFPPQERGRAMGIIGSMVSVGLTLGPTLGGLLVGLLSWHAIFTINLPIGALGVILASRLLQDDRVHHSGHFDAAGAVLLLVALVTLSLGLTQAPQVGWTSPMILALLAVAVASGAAFVAVERRAPEPAVDLGLLRNRVFAAGNISLLLTFMASFTSVLLAPFYFQRLRGMSPQEAGLFLTVVPLVQFVVAPFAGSLSDRIGAAVLAPIGLAIAGVGFLLISGLTATSSVFEIVSRTAVMGVGFGLFQAPNSSAVMTAAPRHRFGVASSFLALMRSLGMAVGLALSGAIFTSREAAYLSQGLTAPAAFVGGFRDAHVVAAGICFAAMLVARTHEGRRHAGQRSGHDFPPATV